MSALDETIRYLHKDPEEVPWVTTGFPGYDQRLIHFRPDDDFFVVQLRAEPGVESPPHRHLGPLYSVTTKGRWGHDRDYVYGAGVYVYEPVDVVHRFLVPPDEGTELFTVGFGGVELLSDDGSEVLAALTVQQQVESYFALCEAAGLPRPNVLQ
jgi:quercetin dioxygenase-like cupin family protein